MLKKLTALMIAILLFASLTACSDKDEQAVENENKYVAYVGIGGTLDGTGYIFDGNIKNKNGGNVKMISAKEYEEKKKDYDNMEVLRSGTYQYTPENNTLCISLEVDGKEKIKTYFVKNDFLVPDTLMREEIDVDMSGDYLDCKVQSAFNVTEYRPDGTYVFYVLNKDYNIDYKSRSSGVYYIKNNLVYTKNQKETEYKVLGLVLENKLYDLSLSTIFKRDN